MIRTEVTWIALGVTWSVIAWSAVKARGTHRRAQADADVTALITADRDELLEIVAGVAVAPRRMLPDNVVQVDLDADFYEALIARHVHGAVRLPT